ncbi:MAG: DUF5611 family protein [Candidatus Thermoplasmatota archaeon]|nr:DUF5611 family protein [Candidatus Thermoplasmatota archaeon]
MREYPVKKGIKTDPETVLSICKKYSSNAVLKGNNVDFTMPGLKSISVECGGKNLMIETVTDPDFKDPMTSINIYNKLLTEITGLDSKERKKRLSKI